VPARQPHAAREPGTATGGKFVPAIVKTFLLLVISNAFMTYAWYGHLRDLAGRPWYVAALLAWCVAFFEYQFQVPANRIGYTALTLPQLKILQEVISLLVFVPFSLWYMRAPLGADYFWACLCILGAVYFMFRSLG
jgi:uncharacterized protein (DUF486 family)